MMANSLEIYELVEQLTWSHRISTFLVHSRKSYVVRNLMAMTASKKCAKLALISRQRFLCRRYK